MATDAVSVTPRVLLLFTCLFFASGGQAVIEPVEVKDVAILPGTLLYAGETATLYCIITGSGHPVPTVTWSRQADALPAGAEADGSAASLTLRNVVADDSGVYVCTADNHVGRPATGNISIVVCPDLPDPETCGDSNPSCLGWAKLGECESNPGWMHPNCKLSCGICIPGLPLECINRGRGRALDTWECNDVTNVPDGVRNSLSLDNFYQKYLHAYGIPILGSSIVPDEAIRRACYDVLFLLADRKDVRDSYYNFNGRAAIMAETEVTLDIPEHSDLDVSYNTRARGLGATVSRPVSTGAEENVLCYTSDRYKSEDIFLHEFSHGIDLLGARQVIPGWRSRLQAAYNSAKAAGLWQNTYADDTIDEYFAEGEQRYRSWFVTLRLDYNGYIDTESDQYRHRMRPRRNSSLAVLWQNTYADDTIDEYFAEDAYADDTIDEYFAEVLQGKVEGARPRGRPRRSWITDLKEWTGLTANQMARLAEDRQHLVTDNAVILDPCWNATLSSDAFPTSVQGYFDVNAQSLRPNGIHNHVNNRTELQEYDPGLYRLIREIFPCGNTLVKRCDPDYQNTRFRFNCFAEGRQRDVITGNRAFGMTDRPTTTLKPSTMATATGGDTTTKSTPRKPSNRSTPRFQESQTTDKPISAATLVTPLSVSTVTAMTLASMVLTASLQP
ncbi:hypothetical protein Bbelb_093020 [Branchiostoma belcheri]|nr:hypothetical protein Bbelb_093020 [Branchiostoma belcheri]